MKHQICMNAGEFSGAIRDAAIYAGKDSDRGLDRVILTAIPKEKALAVIGCDGLGYYERRIALVTDRKQPKPSLPEKEMRLVIAMPDVALLSKFIGSGKADPLMLQVDDQIVNDRYTATLTLKNGLSTTFFCTAHPDLPDLNAIKAHAQKGKKKTQPLDKLQMPVNELIRAGKVFPGKNSFAQISTCKGIAQGVMALLECKTDETDISVIFMLNEAENK